MSGMDGEEDEQPANKSAGGDTAVSFNHYRFGHERVGRLT